MASKTPGLPADFFGTGSQAAGMLVVPAAEEIFLQDAPSTHVFLIQEGLVKMTRGEHTGRQVMVGLHQPGWILGAAPVILERPYVATAMSITRCRLRQMSGSAFRSGLDADPSFARRIHRLLLGELYEGVVRMGGLGTVPARGRLEGLLRTLVDAQDHRPGTSMPLPMPLKQADLAQAVGVSREHLLRLLKQLEVDGLLHRKGGRILVDPVRLP